MVSHLLGDLQLAAITQVFGDVSGAESVTAKFCLDSSLLIIRQTSD